MAEAENHGNWLLCAMSIAWVWSSLMFFVRVWAKVNVKRWGVEDYTISVAYMVSTVDFATMLSAVHRGYGLPIDHIPQMDRLDVTQTLYASQQLYILALGLSKASTALFVIHLANSGPQSRPGYLLVGVTAVWTISSMLAIALRDDLGHPWQTLDGSQSLYFRWIVVEATGLAIEFLLLLLSGSLLMSLQLKKQKRLVILSAFAARLLLVPLVAVRLWQLSPGANTHPTDTSIVPSIITQMTLHFSIFSASITSLRPFLRTFHMDYRLDSKVTSKRNHSSTGHTTTTTTMSSYSPPRYVNGPSITNGQPDRHWADGFTESFVTHTYAMNKTPSKGTATDDDNLLVRPNVDYGRVHQPFPAKALVIEKTVNWTVEYELIANTHRQQQNYMIK